MILSNRRNWLQNCNNGLTKYKSASQKTLTEQLIDDLSDKDDYEIPDDDES